jgi:membrane-bound metal-dependent hydrolase YbcI (DUF457 family)
MIKVEKEIDFKRAFQIALKYLIQGFAIAIVAYYVPLTLKHSLRKPTFNEVFLISLTAALSMYILDYFTTIGAFAKLGMGFELGREIITVAAHL